MIPDEESLLLQVRGQSLLETLLLFQGDALRPSSIKDTSDIIKRYNNMEHVKLDIQFGLCVLLI